MKNIPSIIDFAGNVTFQGIGPILPALKQNTNTFLKKMNSHDERKALDKERTLSIDRARIIDGGKREVFVVGMAGGRVEFSSEPLHRRRHSIIVQVCSVIILPPPKKSIA